MDTTLTSRASAKIIAYTPPASPGASTSVPMANATTPVFPTTTASSTVPTSNLPTHHQSSSPVSGGSSVAAATSSRAASSFIPMFTPASTPKKDLLNAAMLQTIREKLLTPGGSCELQALAFENPEVEQAMAMKLVKERYLISAQPSHISAAAAAKTPASYRHLIDLTSSNLKCLDVYTGEEFLCKIINEPLHKVQRAYFQLQQDDDLCHSKIYGHALIRGVHDIVPLSSNRTYIIIAPVRESRDTSGIAMGVYENLHTYIRNQKRIGEAEARTIFHQICQTVQVCHRNGIILRDLKLKRFYFIDEARTKLQYESLEGSMILDDPTDDTLSDKIGCPLYTAPELLCPHPTYQGKPADMWSLGVILYTMLVGQYPFYEKANCNLITIIRHGNVQIPSSLSKSVRWLLLSLLRKNFAERLTASHIFLVPWLREQRPFYMYLPVNVEVMEDDDDYSENFSEGIAELQLEDAVQASEEEDDDIGVQPLDYTHTTLQMEEQLAAAASTRGRGSGDMEMDVDVGMG